MYKALKLNSKQSRKWRKRIANLREKMPLPYPVKVRTVKMSGAGWCYHHYDRFGRVKSLEIRIANWLQYQGRVDTLLHEWAHALECAAYGHEINDPHSAVWGVLYAECYRADDELAEWVKANGLEE